ncbi:MAG: TetR/AcrR family transcriptional regulator [Tateyamaria sp.]|uniref:TetR/AcrR family transcriptional regulator n=1 Tax=Tateyamaria sp. TaxID=1929288 RepID=UPI00329D020F
MVGRPTNRDERYRQVMGALVRSVARYGLDGATLSQIAKEAGLTRPLIRHHIGNREDMIAALTDFVLKSFEDQTKALVSSLPKEGPSDALINLLFSEGAVSQPDMVLGFAALTARASDDAKLRQRCRETLLDFEAAVANTLRRDHGDADDAALGAAAHGITALYFNLTSLAPLDMPPAWKTQAARVARNLLEELDTPT